MSPRPSPRTGALVVAAGGALGALVRWAVGVLWPVGVAAFPWPTLLINVVGAAALAALPLLAVVRRQPLAPLFLGTGVLGGFTTMSSASVQTVQLVDAGQPLRAAAYVVGTLVAAVLVVALVQRLAGPPDPAPAEEDDR